MSTPCAAFAAAAPLLSSAPRRLASVRPRPRPLPAARRRGGTVTPRAALAGPQRPSRAAEVHVESDSIETTPGQLAAVALFGALTAGVLGRAVAGAAAAGPVEGVAVAAALVAGWAFADLGTAVYHHAVDNYGRRETPLFGFQCAAFQGHHTSPWTICQREFANNLYRLTFPTSPQMAALLVLPLPPVVLAGLGSALMWIVLSQELHRQAHFTKPAAYARVLQNLGIAISRREHGLHHSSPYDGHYGIVSGLWNPLLDRTHFFRRVEAAVYRWNGVEPASWRLDSKVKELALRL